MAITINGSGITSANIADGTITASDISASEVKNLKSGRKNLIINGGFDVWQRGTSFSSNGYTADRWNSIFTGATISKESITDLVGFSYALKLTTGAADPYFIQKVEGTYFRGQTITFSFWVKGDTPPHTMLYDYTNTYSAHTPTLIETVGAWKRYSNTYNIPSTTTTQDYLTLRIDLAESSSSIQYLTGVQLELGSVATDFEHRSYGEELALCQRFYLNLDETRVHVGSSATGSNADWYFPIMYPVEMRAVPTATYSYTGSGATSNGFYNQGSAKHYGKFSVRPTTTTECNVMADTLRLDAEL